ncbi:uncharacterized protein C2orf16-like [Lytechinus variegatus]|uniref:uncharacterized protein C2orf16-like n=1 Tax=Lytechinus variegatus TaxID=7654 RepID=UPI001BB0E0BE|nr:uncharacterized protein C2orf16-like [Lytechinus variegatus]
MNSFSSPEDQLHCSSPRCQPHPSLQKRHSHSPPKYTCNHSPQRYYFNQRIQPSLHRYHNRPQPTNYRNHPPPSESSRHHRHHARDLSSHSQPSDIRDAIYEPLMDIYHHSPRGYSEYSSPRDSHSNHDIPRHHSPYRDDRYF